MRSMLVGAAALLAALAAAPGVASAATGFADVTIGQVQADEDDDDIDVAGIGGSIAADMGGARLQVDGTWLNGDADGGGDVDLFGVGGRLSWQHGDWRTGGYLGWTRIDEDGGDDADEVTVAAELQRYFSRTTAGAAIVYSDANDFDLTAWTLEGDLEHFYTDNISVGANLLFGNVDGDGGDSDYFGGGVNAEMALASTPFSLFGGWQHTEIDDFDISTDSFNIGLRYNWGGTLMDRNRSGANFNRRAGTVGRLFGVAT